MSPDDKPKRKIDRVELFPESMDKLAVLQKQIDETCPEVMMSRKELANWIILQHKEVLSEAELRLIRESFFDSVQYLKSLLKKAEAAKTEGRKIELSEIAIPTVKPKRARAVKEKNHIGPMNDDQTAADHSENYEAQSSVD